MSAIRRLLERAQPGTRGGVARHIERAEVLRRLIRERYGIDAPEGWRQKHLRWCLERALAERSPATRYDYYRTARALAAALGRWPAWEPHLRGPWMTPTGAAWRAAERGASGRPAKLAHRARGARPPSATRPAPDRDRRPGPPPEVPVPQPAGKKKNPVQPS